MKHDEQSVVGEARAHAREELRGHGQIRPAVFMLVSRSPQTGATMSQPAAIGHVVEEPFDEAGRDAWLDSIRAEVQRLAATAVAVCLEAEAELEGGRALPMAVLYVEDRDGAQVLVAPIERTGSRVQLAEFAALDDPDPGAAVGIAPLLVPAAPQPT